LRESREEEPVFDLRVVLLSAGDRFHNGLQDLRRRPALDEFLEIVELEQEHAVLDLEALRDLHRHCFSFPIPGDPTAARQVPPPEPAETSAYGRITLDGALRPAT